MLHPLSTDCLHIIYRPDLHQLAGRWQRPVAETELHAGYEALRQVAHQHDCRHWLIDSRRRTNRSLNGPQWITTRFLPQVQAELGGVLCVGFLVLPTYLVTLGGGEPAVADGLVQYARFVEEGAANAWLHARQELVPQPA